MRFRAVILLASMMASSFVPSSQADLANLSEGILIAHYVPELSYTYELEDVCAEYLPYAITSADEQNTRINTDGNTANRSDRS